MSKCMILLNLFFIIQAHALEMNSNAVLEVKIAKVGLTRISVADQRIQDVFIYPQNLQDHLTLHQSGHVFVVPEGLQGDVFLTVITDRGVTQDLKLVASSDKKLSPLILTPKQAEKIALPTNEPAKLGEILKIFVTGQVPEGFRFAPLNKAQRTHEKITFMPFRSYHNDSCRMDIYKAQAPSLDKDKLTLSNLARSGDLATALGEVVSSRREESVFLYVLSEEKKL